MQLEDYFEFEKFDTKFGPVERIRIKGHRIAIEHVLDCFKNGVSPEYIAREAYPSLTLEEIYATITYYLHEKEKIEAYLARVEDIGEAYYQEHLQKPEDPLVTRLKALKEAKKRPRLKPVASEPPAPVESVKP